MNTKLSRQVEMIALVHDNGPLSTHEIADMTGYAKKHTAGLSMSLGSNPFLRRNRDKLWDLSPMCKELIKAIGELSKRKDFEE